jgi:hypothetical protein
MNRFSTRKGLSPSKKPDDGDDDGDDDDAMQHWGHRHDNEMRMMSLSLPTSSLAIVFQHFIEQTEVHDVPHLLQAGRGKVILRSMER